MRGSYLRVMLHFCVKAIKLCFIILTLQDLTWLLINNPAASGRGIMFKEEFSSNAASCGEFNPERLKYTTLTAKAIRLGNMEKPQMVSSAIIAKISPVYVVPLF